MGKPLVRFCEGLECNFGMDEILWHRRETRRQTDKTKLILQPGESPVYSNSPEKGLPAEVAMAGVLSCAKRVFRNVRPMSLGKKRVNAPEEHGGVWVQSPTQGLQR